MRDPINVHDLLTRAAQADNAALPFAQWKEALLEKAAGLEDAIDAPPLDFTTYIEMNVGESPKKKKPGARPLYRITGAVAGAAAAFLILLSVNGRFGTGKDAPAPAAMESRELAVADDSARFIEDGAPELEMAAPQAAAPESPMTDMGGGYVGESSAAESRTGEVSPMMLDPLLEEAIRAVDEALSANAMAKDSNDGALPYAYQAIGESFVVTPLTGGEEARITLETAYVVVYPDGSAYLVKPLDEGGVEALGALSKK